MPAWACKTSECPLGRSNPNPNPKIMLVTQIAGIDQLPVGTKLEAIAGKIHKVYEFKSDTNNNGPWSLQNLKVFDASGETTVVLKNRPQLGNDWMGADVYFVAGQYKNRPSGVIVDEYNGKRRIIVNEHATIEEGEPQQQTRQQRPAPTQQRQQPAPQQRQQAPQTRQTQQRQQAPDLQEEERQEQQNARPQTQQRQQEPTQQRPAREAKPEKTAEERVHEAKRDILRLTTLYTFCHDAAVLHAASVHSRHGHLQHPASIGALATTLFIEANKQQIGRNIPAVVPTQLPAPTFKMGEIITEYERHQKELASDTTLADTSAAIPSKDDLSAMPEKEW